MKYNKDDIIKAVGKNAFMAGTVYQGQGRVLFLTQDKTGIVSKVHGNERVPYVQHIQINTINGKVDISGSCSCPVGFNCKHVAAALVEAQGKTGGANSSKSVTLAPISMGKPAYVAQPQPPAPPVELPYELKNWLESLEKAQISAEEDYPDGINQRLFYIFKPVIKNNVTLLGLDLKIIRLLKSGEYSKSYGDYAPQYAFANSPAKFLRPSDIRLCTALSRDGYVGSDITISTDYFTKLLPEIIATGRARWINIDSPSLTYDEPKQGKIEWEQADNGAMRPHLQTQEGLQGFAATPPLYYNTSSYAIGELDVGMPPKIAGALLNAPSVALEHVALLNEKMEQRLPSLKSVAPPQPKPAIIVKEPPVPILKLIVAQMPAQITQQRGHYYYQQPPDENVLVARLYFRYNKCEIDLNETRAVPIMAHKGQIYELHRDTRVEKKALNLVGNNGFSPVAQERKNVPKQHLRDFVPDSDFDQDTIWFDILYNVMPQLQEQGFEIQIADDFPIKILRGDGDVEAEFKEGSGIDWLELGLGVMVDGKRIDLIDPIVNMISKGYFSSGEFQTATDDNVPIYIALGDGRFVALPKARFTPILNAIYELASGGSHGKGMLKLSHADAAAIGAFEASTAFSGLVWRGGDNIRSMGRKLTQSNGIPTVTLPSTFKANLRPYQLEGVSWLSFLRDVGLGGILADDMGLGKTVQALAFLAIEKAEGRLDAPALVIAPTSLMANWRRETEKFTPDFKVLTLQGSDRKEKFGEIAISDLVLTTYPLIARDHDTIAAHKWHIMLLDEAQTIKNPDANTTKLIANLDAKHRFCLTGTPLENHLGELWSLFSFASPGFLGDRTSFTRNWRSPIEKRGDTGRAKLLAKRVKPFMLRRTKAEVANDLPPKTEIMERIDMEAAQTAIYDSIRLSMHKKVRDAIAAKGFARSRIIILDALLKLRQTCCDPRLLKLDKKTVKSGSAKLKRLNELLVELLDEGRKIIVFSQFTSMLELIREELDNKGTQYCLLTGKTKDRESQIRNFQDGDIPVFLISLKAGGTGLNLTAADTIILYDPWWNPAVEEQAIDRAHRIGQERPVFVHKLVINGTIEEKMEALKEKKRALAQSIFDSDGSPTLAMTESDLDMLFAE